MLPRRATPTPWGACHGVSSWLSRKARRRPGFSVGIPRGDGSAMYQAAYFYENGFGTDKDTDTALLLYTEAAEQGVRSAAVRLYEIYTYGLGHILPDGKKAAHYLFLSGEDHD